MDEAALQAPRPARRSAGLRRAVRYLARSTATVVAGGLIVTLAAGAAGLVAGLHRVGPGRAAVVREVFGRTGALLGPQRPPYRVRVVANTGRSDRWYWAQPPPFGVVEEVVELDRPIEFELNVSRWRKDAVTGIVTDRVWARELHVVVRFSLADVERYAREIDPMWPPPPVASAAPRRQDVLAERVRRTFQAFLDAELARLAQDLPARLQFATRRLELTGDEEVVERLTRWGRFVERNPWLVLTAEGFARIQAERPEILQNLTLILQLDAAGVTEEQLNENLKATLGQLRGFFREYAAAHPDHVDAETWTWLLRHGDPSLSSPVLAVRFVESHLDRLGRRFRARLDEAGFEAVLGLTPEEVAVSVSDRPVQAYPVLSSSAEPAVLRQAPGT